MNQPLAVALFPSLLVVGLIGLHYLDRHFHRRDRDRAQRQHRADVLANLRRCRDAETEGDEGGWPHHRDAA